MADLLFGFVFDEREEIPESLIYFGFVGQKSHPDVVGETIDGTEKIFGAGLRRGQDWSTEVNVNVVKFPGCVGEISTERFFVLF